MGARSGKEKRPTIQDGCWNGHRDDRPPVAILGVVDVDVHVRVRQGFPVEFKLSIETLWKGDVLFGASSETSKHEHAQKNEMKLQGNANTPRLFDASSDVCGSVVIDSFLFLRLAAMCEADNIIREGDTVVFDVNGERQTLIVCRPKR